MLKQLNATQEAEALGVNASLQVVPYYNKPSQEGIIQHFKAIAESTSLPIMLYNIPGRTGINMQPETIATLSGIPNIVAIKEAAGSIEQVKHIKSLVPEDFDIYSGDDGLTLPFMQEGAVGVVSVASHCAGSLIQSCIQAYLNGDIKKAEDIHDKLTPLYDVLFITSNQSVKAALSLMGFKPGRPRLPLVEATQSQIEGKRCASLFIFNLLNENSKYLSEQGFALDVPPKHGFKWMGDGEWSNSNDIGCKN